MYYHYYWKIINFWKIYFYYKLNFEWFDWIFYAYLRKFLNQINNWVNIINCFEANKSLFNRLGYENFGESPPVTVESAAFKYAPLSVVCLRTNLPHFMWFYCGGFRTAGRG